jgi:hypothetical protein
MMNRLKFHFSFLIVSILVLQSCSLEKRRYTSGYHLQWKKGTSELRTKTEVSNNPTKTFNTITASSEKKKGIILLTPDSIACDTLIMKNGTEIKVKVLEVTPTEVKYKYCSNINGPLYVAYRYNISYVKYANGTMDSFVNEHPPVVNKSFGNNQTHNGGYNQNSGVSNRNPIENYAVNEYVKNTSLAVLILGIVSIPLSFIFVGIITAIIAVALGKKCMRLINQDPSLFIYSQRNTIGFVLGWIVVGLALLAILIGLIALIVVLSVI